MLSTVAFILTLLECGGHQEELSHTRDENAMPRTAVPQQCHGWLHRTGPGLQCEENTLLPVILGSVTGAKLYPHGITGLRQHSRLQRLCSALPSRLPAARTPVTSPAPLAAHIPRPSASPLAPSVPPSASCPPHLPVTVTADCPSSLVPCPAPSSPLSTSFCSLACFLSGTGDRAHGLHPEPQSQPLFIFIFYFEVRSQYSLRCPRQV